MQIGKLRNYASNLLVHFALKLERDCKTLMMFSCYNLWKLCQLNSISLHRPFTRLLILKLLCALKLLTEVIKVIAQHRILQFHSDCLYNSNSVGWIRASILQTYATISNRIITIIALPTRMCTLQILQPDSLMVAFSKLPARDTLFLVQQHYCSITLCSFQMVCGTEYDHA